MFNYATLFGSKNLQTNNVQEYSGSSSTCPKNTKNSSKFLDTSFHTGEVPLHSLWQIALVESKVCKPTNQNLLIHKRCINKDKGKINVFPSPQTLESVGDFRIGVPFLFFFILSLPYPKP